MSLSQLNFKKNPMGMQADKRFGKLFVSVGYDPNGKFVASYKGDGKRTWEVCYGGIDDDASKWTVINFAKRSQINAILKNISMKGKLGATTTAIITEDIPATPIIKDHDLSMRQIFEFRDIVKSLESTPAPEAKYYIRDHHDLTSFFTFLSDPADKNGMFFSRPSDHGERLMKEIEALNLPAISPMKIIDGIELYNICDIDPNFDLSDDQFDIKLKRFMDAYNMAYYAEGREDYADFKAVEKAKVELKRRVVCEDLS